MRCARLRLAQVSELLLCLLLHVLEHIQDAGAVRLVGCSCWGTEVLVFTAGALLRLHHRKELPLVGTWERGCIDHCAQGRQKLVDAGDVHLCERCWVLCHLALNHHNSAANGVNDVHQLGFIGSEILRLLRSHLCGALEVGLVRRNAGSQLLNLCRGNLPIARGLADGCLKLLLFCRGSLDLEALVRGRIVTPLDKRLVGLLLFLAFLCDLGRKAVQELQDLAQRIRSSPRCDAGRHGFHEEDQADGASPLHCG
mmetsp:Transcript_92228/g.245029  ORF Transcript_92228/g.245029 Transcript_92228/m.245029 type:complete len:254 (-) Transcript_92228:30-791(-)